MSKIERVTKVAMEKEIRSLKERINFLEADKRYNTEEIDRQKKAFSIILGAYIEDNYNSKSNRILSWLEIAAKIGELKGRNLDYKALQIIDNHTIEINRVLTELEEIKTNHAGTN